MGSCCQSTVRLTVDRSAIMYVYNKISPLDVSDISYHIGPLNGYKSVEFLSYLRRVTNSIDSLYSIFRLRLLRRAVRF